MLVPANERVEHGAEQIEPVPAVRTHVGIGKANGLLQDAHGLHDLHFRSS